MHLATAVAQYLDDSQRQGLLRPLTITKYRYMLRLFVAYMTDHHPDLALADIRRVHLNDFLTAIATDRNLSKTTIQHYVSTLRSFFDHFVYLELLSDNPAARLRRPRRDKPIVKPLTLEETQRLITLDLTPEESRFRPHAIDYGRRNQQIVTLMVTAGIRRAELCALSWHDLNLTVPEPTLAVVCGKGGKGRIVPLLGWVASELAAYQRDLGAAPTDPVFASAQGTRLQPEAITAIFQRLVTPAMGQRVTAHMLRATYATLLSNNGADILHISKLMGHSQLTTTQIYVQPGKDELTAAAQCHPLAQTARQLLLPLDL